MFLGSRLDGHFESTFYQRINRRLEAEAGGHWSNPLAVAEGVNTLAEVTAAADIVRQLVNGPASLEYWGKRALRWPDKPRAWGWKDPRNGLLLPIWSNVYPDARVVFVRRHPAAAALSLHRRSHEIFQAARQRSEDTGKLAMLKSAKRLYRGQPLLADSLRSLDMATALRISLDYNEKYCDVVSGTELPVVTVKYEDLVQDGPAQLELISRELDLGASHDVVSEAGQMFHTRGVRSYEENPELMALIARERDRLRRLGY